jgi:hypothetical protein
VHPVAVQQQPVGGEGGVGAPVDPIVSVPSALIRRCSISQRATSAPPGDRCRGRGG